MESDREFGYKVNQNHLKAAFTEAGMKSLDTSFVFSTHHNKYHRIKQGDWGQASKKALPVIL